MRYSDHATTIAGVTVHTNSLQQILEKITSELKKSTLENTDKPFTLESRLKILPVYTVNPEFVVLADEFTSFKNILNRAFITVPDGIGILYAGLLKGNGFDRRITGIDLLHSLTQLAAEHDFTVGFLGGKQNAAQETMNLFKKQYPSLQAWSDPGPNIEIEDSPNSLNSLKTLTNLIKIDQNSYDLESLFKKISQTDILFVAFGAPKQEFFIEWLKTSLRGSMTKQSHWDRRAPHVARDDEVIARNHQTLIAIGVGGSFDEISGISPRPPQWIQRIGLKWLFRLGTEPWRWKRQVRLLKILKLLLKK